MADMKSSKPVYKQGFAAQFYSKETTFQYEQRLQAPKALLYHMVVEEEWKAGEKINQMLIEKIKAEAAPRDAARLATLRAEKRKQEKAQRRQLREEKEWAMMMFRGALDRWERAQGFAASGAMSEKPKRPSKSTFFKKKRQQPLRKAKEVSPYGSDKGSMEG